MTSSTKLGISVYIIALILLQVDSLAARVLTRNGSDGFWQRTEVVLYNDIDAAVTLHCKSKDDDLGIHVLQKGESWNFSFDPNLFLTTLFYSSFQWDDQLHYFDVYRQKRDYLYKMIWWRITTTGLCYRAQGSEYCFPWNSATSPRG